MNVRMTLGDFAIYCFWPMLSKYISMILIGFTMLIDEDHFLAALKSFVSSV
jgi:hypothetical protein